MLGGDIVRSVEEQMRVILRRRDAWRARRAARRLSALAALLGAGLMAALLVAPGVSGSVKPMKGSVLGATILGPEAGGYVIVALLAFALGVVLALAAAKRKQAKRSGEDKP